MMRPCLTTTTVMLWLLFGVRPVGALTLAPPDVEQLAEGSVFFGRVLVVAAELQGSSQANETPCGVRYRARPVESFLDRRKSGRRHAVLFWETAAGPLNVPLRVGREYLVFLKPTAKVVRSSRFLQRCRGMPALRADGVFAVAPYDDFFLDEGKRRLSRKCGRGPYLHVWDAFAPPDGVTHCMVMDCPKGGCLSTFEGLWLVSWPELVTHLRAVARRMRPVRKIQRTAPAR